MNMGYALKVITMIQTLNEIMSGMTLGEKYEQAGMNIWQNNIVAKA